MNEFAEIAIRIIREGSLSDSSGAGPLPPESVAPEDQAKFESLLKPQDEPEPTALEPTALERAPQPAGLSGDGILNSLMRMSGSLPPVGALDSPQSLIAFQSTLTQGTTSLNLVSEIQSRTEDGIDQLTRG